MYRNGMSNIHRIFSRSLNLILIVYIDQFLYTYEKISKLYAIYTSMR